MCNRVLPRLLLLMIVVGGLTLRTWNVNFDQGINSHPDERWTTCWIAPRMALPASWAEFWDARRSPLNPLWKPQEEAPEYYSYGHFPLYLGLLNGALLRQLAPLAERLGLPAEVVELMNRDPHSCGGVAVAGRLVIAFLDTLTILLLYLLGRRMMGQAVGLLAAAFYAFAAQAVQLSHFFTMDPASTTFTVLSVLGGVMMVQERSWRAIFITGIGAGLAIASKFSALPILAVPVVASLLILWDEAMQSRYTTSPPNGRRQFYAVSGMLVAIGIAGLTFLFTSPYALLDWETFLEATLVRQGRMVRGIDDLPFTRQYRNTIPYLYFIEQQIWWGLWWPLGIIALTGTGYTAFVLGQTLWRAVVELSKRFVPGKLRSWPNPRLSQLQSANLIVWSWVFPYFALTGAFMTKFNRYMSPLLPFLLLFGALLIGWLWRWGTSLYRGWLENRSFLSCKNYGSQTEQSIKQQQRQHAFSTRTIQSFAIGLAIFALSGGIFWSLAYVNGVYNREHTWIQAGRWIFENVPAGSTILAEDWDDSPIDALPDNPAINRNARGITISKWGPYEEDTAEKYELLKSRLREADYVYYSSKRIYESVDELPRRYPMTIRYYDAMWRGELGFEMAFDITAPRRCSASPFLIKPRMKAGVSTIIHVPRSFRKRAS